MVLALQFCLIYMTWYLHSLFSEIPTFSEGHLFKTYITTILLMSLQYLCRHWISSDSISSDSSSSTRLNPITSSGFTDWFSFTEGCSAKTVWNELLFSWENMHHKVMVSFSIILCSRERPHSVVSEQLSTAVRDLSPQWLYTYETKLFAPPKIVSSSFNICIHLVWGILA